MTVVVKIVGCRADVFRELKQPQWRRKIKRHSNINYFAITAFCSRATFLTNLNYATGGLEERRGIKYRDGKIYCSVFIHTVGCSRCR